MPGKGVMILSFLAIAYIANMSFTLYKLFYLPQCNEFGYCIHPRYDLATEYEFTLYGKNRRKFVKQERVKLTEAYQKDFTIKIPYQVKNNKSYEIHLEAKPILNGKVVVDAVTIKSSMSLTKLTIPDADSFNLLNEKERKATKTTKHEKPVQHMYKRVVVTCLAEPIVFHYNEVPSELMGIIKLQSDPTHKFSMIYDPIIYLNSFVLVSDKDLVNVNKLSDDHINITFQIQPTSLGKLRLLNVIDQSMNELKLYGFNDKNIESLRGIFTDTNLYLLITTIVIAVFHLLFDLLSFKHDVSFWKNTKSTIGISPRVVTWRCISSTIILLYLLEENTSFLVLIPFVIGMFVEFWKLTKIWHFSWLFSTRSVTKQQQDEEGRTNDIDAEGMWYLLWLIVPLCIVGAVYSLFYMPHKSWYSWTVNTLANGVYVFGFLFMTPQLFINYKLKSVAHLPWKALTYKAFNTFIDDFFAFIIVMPTSHRLACFRDDIIFVIYLYQRWLYPVDKSRVNEFGGSGDDQNNELKSGPINSTTEEKKEL